MKSRYFDRFLKISLLLNPKFLFINKFQKRFSNSSSSLFKSNFRNARYRIDKFRISVDSVAKIMDSCSSGYLIK